MRCGSRGLSVAAFARTRAGHTAWDVSHLIESANAWNPSRPTALQLALVSFGGVWRGANRMDRGILIWLRLLAPNPPEGKYYHG